MENKKSEWNGFAVCGDVAEIEAIINNPGLINLDANDITLTFSPDGDNYVVSGQSDTIVDAMSKALEALTVALKDIKRLMVQIVIGTEAPKPSMEELGEFVNLMVKNKEVDFRWGIREDAAIGSQYKVVIIVGC